MSQYASTTNLAQLGLPAAALEGLTTTVQDEHLTKASGKIDSYLRGRYKLPLATPPPDEIVDACAVIAAYTLLVFRGFNPDAYDENFRMRYTDLVGDPRVHNSKGWLDKLSAGMVHLDIAADDTPEVSEGRPRASTRKSRGWYDANGDRDDRI